VDRTVHFRDKHRQTNGECRHKTTKPWIFDNLSTKLIKALANCFGSSELCYRTTIARGIGGSGRAWWFGIMSNLVLTEAWTDTRKSRSIFQYISYEHVGTFAAISDFALILAASINRMDRSKMTRQVQLLQAFGAVQNVQAIPIYSLPARPEADFTSLQPRHDDGKVHR